MVADDFERILLEVVPEEPTALSVVVEDFRARTQLDPSVARVEIVEAMRRMLSRTSAVKIGKVTKKPRRHLETTVFEELEVQFLDRDIKGWSKLRSSVFAELLDRWPDNASAPPDDVLMQRVAPVTASNE